MKILHLCLCGPVTDNWNYQDNMLTKYHKKLGHEVTIITSEWIWNSEGELIRNKDIDYVNDDGVRMIRIPIKGKNNFNRKLKRYKDFNRTISDLNPDVIFIHGSQFIDIRKVVLYVKKNRHIKVFVDNHADTINSGRNWISKYVLHKIIWKYYAKKIEPYTEMFYGVLPARVDFLVELYKIPREKVELLLLGADDEKVEAAQSLQIKKELRERFEIKDNDFLIMTGGKIDDNKTQTLLLMKAIRDMNKSDLKLLIFGSVNAKYKEEFYSLLGDNVLYIGWVDPNDTYKYFNIADLVVFPGLHSVFWEQCVGLGKPCVFKHMDGFTHIDVGGNCEYLYNDSVNEMIEVINKITANTEIYEHMKYIAENIGMEKFSYKKIAERSINT